MSEESQSGCRSLSIIVVSSTSYESNEDEQGQGTPQVFIFVKFVRFLKDSLKMLFSSQRKFVNFSIWKFDALHQIPVEKGGFYCLISAGLTQVFYTFRANLGHITV